MPLRHDDSSHRFRRTAYLPPPPVPPFPEPLELHPGHAVNGASSFPDAVGGGGFGGGGVEGGSFGRELAHASAVKRAAARAGVAPPAALLAVDNAASAAAAEQVVVARFVDERVVWRHYEELPGGVVVFRDGHSSEIAGM